MDSYIGEAKVIKRVPRQCTHNLMPSPRQAIDAGLDYGSLLECPSCRAVLKLSHDQRDGDYWENPG
jgi:hypothetical protein